MEYEVRVHRDCAYLDPSRTERLDVYVPLRRSGAEPMPGIVVIHGGGWFSQAKDGRREQAIAGDLAGAGFVCASVDYRLVDFEQPTEARRVWPVNVQDCKRAVRFLRDHAAQYGVDPDRIASIGGSAGGHLAALLGCTSASGALNPPGPREAYAVQAVVCMYGIGDMARWIRDSPTRRKGMDAAELMLGGAPEEAPQRFTEASPESYAGPDTPPMLLLHGTADEIISHTESEAFAQELMREGAACELIVVEGAAHSFDLQPPQRDLRPAVVGFLRKSFAQV